MKMLRALWSKLQNTKKLLKIQAALFVLSGLLFTPGKLKAGLFIEPYLGYGLGVQEYNLKSGSSPQSVFERASQTSF